MSERSLDATHCLTSVFHSPTWTLSHSTGRQWYRTDTKTTIYTYKFFRIKYHCCKVVNILRTVFGRPFVERFALCYRTVVCLSVLTVCNVGVLWPNGSMDYRMPFGMEVGLGPGHIVLDGDSAPPWKKAQQPPPHFRPTLLRHGRPSQQQLRFMMWGTKLWSLFSEALFLN